MRKRNLWLIAVLAASMTAAGFWWHRHQMRFYEGKGRKELQDAMAIVMRPMGETSCRSGASCQTGYRLAAFIYPRSEFFYYQPSPEDLPLWKGLMRDTSASIYGRQCAAFFLLDSEAEARSFLLEEARQKDPRRRFNAATVLFLYADEKIQQKTPPPSWVVDLSISLLAGEFLDGVKTRESREGVIVGSEPEGDSADILMSPLDVFCDMFGSLKEEKAVDALIGLLGRDPTNSSAAYALGTIGNVKAIPALLSILKSGSGSRNAEIVALGQLKCHEAVPVLCALLGHPKSTISGRDDSETRTILNAMRDIGDKAAIVPIKELLAQSSSAEQTGDARRVLVQLADDDPVPGLLALFHANGITPAKEPPPSGYPEAPQKSEFPHEEYRKAAVLSDLGRYPDQRVVYELMAIARYFDSAYLRREAISLLSFSKSPYAARGLVSLLNVQFPRTLKAEAGWRQGHRDLNKELHKCVVDALKQATKEDLGDNADAWTRWLDSHGAPSLPKPSQ